jgi:hypothetical protein
MDMLVGFIQIVCICGLLYGLYLSISCVGTEDSTESCRRPQPRHSDYDPLIADALAANRAPCSDRLARL